MRSTVDESNRSAGIDWLSPLNVLWVIIGIYIVGRLIIGHVLAFPPVWGGSVASERKALALVAAFAISVVLGVWLAPRQQSIRIDFAPRGGARGQRGAALVLPYLIVGVYFAAGLGAALLLFKQLGGIARTVENQAAWATQLKGMGLTPLYSLTYLFNLACVVLAYRALSAGRKVRAGAWVLCIAVLSALLGRRIMILFAGLPLLTYWHYHVQRLGGRRLLLFGAAGFVLFTGILLVRLNLDRGPLLETVGTSLEYALYDALVITVDRAKDLHVLGPAYFIRHPDEFWGVNTGALFLQRLTGFQWMGGATPPTAVGTLWVYFGTPGLLCWGVGLGLVLGRIRLEARSSPPAALIYGLVLFWWFYFLRNGDIVLALKLFLRYLSLLSVLLLCFYRVRIVSARQGLAVEPRERAA